MPVFLTGGVFDCDLAHRRSVAVLCMLYKIRCNLMLPLYGALHVPYVPVRVTRGAVIAHRYSYVPPRYRTSQYRRSLFPYQYLCGTIFKINSDIISQCITNIINRSLNTGVFPNNLKKALVTPIPKLHRRVINAT